MSEEKMEMLVGLTREEYAEYISLKLKEKRLKKVASRKIGKEVGSWIDCEEIYDIMDWEV